jgi:hypothetical protein
MSDPSTASIVDLAPQPPVPLGRHLQLVTSVGERAIFLGTTAIARFVVGNKATEDAAIALLASSGAVSHRDLAPALGRHRNTVSRVH